MFLILLTILGLLFFFLGLNSLKKFLANKNSKKIAETLSTNLKNDYITFGIGIIATIIFQSSSSLNAIIIILVGTKVISLYTGVILILASNIGSSVNTFIFSLDFHFIILGVLFFSLIFYFLNFKNLSKLLFYCFLIFLGLNLLEEGLTLITKTKLFDYLFNINSSPKKLIISSVCLSSLMQSSSLIIIMIQKLYLLNELPIKTAIYFILGSNIGTCSTGVITSINQSKESKILSLFNVLLNVLGMIIVSLNIDYFINLYTKLFINIIDKNYTVSFIHLLYNIISSIFCFIIIKIFHHKKS